MKIKNYIKQLSIIHISLLSTLCFFTIWVIIKINTFNTDNGEENIFLYLVPIFAMLGYFGSQWIFKKMISKIKSDLELTEKLKEYQTTLLVKYALIELPSFIGLFAYYITGNALPLVISICLILYLAVQRPNKENIINSLPLTSHEESQIKEA